MICKPGSTWTLQVVDGKQRQGENRRDPLSVLIYLISTILMSCRPHHKAPSNGQEQCRLRPSPWCKAASGGVAEDAWGCLGVASSLALAALRAAVCFAFCSCSASSLLTLSTSAAPSTVDGLKYLQATPCCCQPLPRVCWSNLMAV